MISRVQSSRREHNMKLACAVVAFAEAPELPRMGGGVVHR